MLVARSYDTDPVSAVDLLWPLVLGLVAAAALSVPAPRRHALAVLRLPRLAILRRRHRRDADHHVLSSWRQQRVQYDLPDGRSVYVAYGFETLPSW